MGYLCSLRRYWSLFVWTLDSCSRFLKHVTFLVETRQKIWDRNMILRLFLVNDGTFHRIIYRIIPCILSHIASHISQFSVALFPRPCYSDVSCKHLYQFAGPDSRAQTLWVFAYEAGPDQERVVYSMCKNDIDSLYRSVWPYWDQISPLFLANTLTSLS